MILPDGRPKKAKHVLQERSYDTKGMKVKGMRAILAKRDDFKGQKCQVGTLLSNSGHICFHSKISLGAESNQESVVPE